MKWLLFAFLIAACDVPIVPRSNAAVDFVHLVDEKASCNVISSNPYAYDAAFCKSGNAVWYVQAGPGGPPKLLKVADLTAPSPVKQ